MYVSTFQKSVVVVHISLTCYRFDLLSTLSLIQSCSGMRCIFSSQIFHAFLCINIYSAFNSTNAVSEYINKHNILRYILTNGLNCGCYKKSHNPCLITTYMCVIIANRAIIMSHKARRQDFKWDWAPHLKLGNS